MMIEAAQQETEDETMYQKDSDSLEEQKRVDMRLGGIFDEGSVEWKKSSETDMSPLVFLEQQDEIFDTSSSLSASVGSTKNSSTANGSFWSISDDDDSDGIYRGTATSNVPSPSQPTCWPYAQLCFDPESKTLVTLMEVNMALDGGNKFKRLRLMERTHNDKKLTDWTEDPGTSRTDSTVSFHSDGGYGKGGLGVGSMEKESYSNPIVFATESAQEPWRDETELDLYLLHECHDPWIVTDKSQGGCAEALKKLVVASKSLVVFKQRSGHDSSFSWNESEEPFAGMGYAFLQEI